MIQVVKCKCCGIVFAACSEPYCYTDNDWLKRIKTYQKEGCEVELIKDTPIKFQKCKNR